MLRALTLVLVAPHQVWWACVPFLKFQISNSAAHPRRFCFNLPTFRIPAALFAQNHFSILLDSHTPSEQTPCEFRGWMRNPVSLATFSSFQEPGITPNTR
jgi:hypothetical protein